jgi:hypothetical protein
MDTAASKRRLGDIFVERSLITQDQLQEALAEQREKGGKLGEILVEMGYMTRVELAGAISEQWTDRGVTFSARKAQEHAVRTEAANAGPTTIEIALRERCEALTADLVTRDERINRQSATIDALLTRVRDLERALAELEAA